MTTQTEKMILVPEATVTLALEALGTCEWVDDGGNGHAEYDAGKVVAALIAIKDALELARISQPCKCGKETVGWCLTNSCAKAGLAQTAHAGGQECLEAWRKDGSPISVAQPEQEQSGFFSREAMKSHSDCHVEQPERTLLEQYDLEQSIDYRKGYEDGRLKGFEVGQRYAKEALTQPEQEPTDSQIMASIGRNYLGVSESRPLGQQWDSICNLFRALIRERYPAPQAKESEQEPVGEAYLCNRCHTPFERHGNCPSCGHNVATKEPIYTTPPRLKPLTDERMAAAVQRDNLEVIAVNRQRMDALRTTKPESATHAAQKDAVFAASIEFLGTLTGMMPPPIETAPAEVFKPFRDFTDKVCSIFPKASLTDEIVVALKDARGVISSINSGFANKLIINDEPVYWQREEWVKWALNEVLPAVDHAIEAAVLRSKT